MYATTSRRKSSEQAIHALHVPLEHTTARYRTVTPDFQFKTQFALLWRCPMTYAYWRKPDNGKSSNDKYAPSELFWEIGQSAKVVNGGIQWPMHMLHEFEYAAFTSLSILQPNGRELNELDSTRLVSDAVSQIILKNGGNKPIQPRQVIDAVNRNAAKLFLQHSKRRLMVTSLSIRGFDGFPIDVLGTKVSAVDRQMFPFPDKLFESRSFVTPHLDDTKYQAIAIDTDQITIHQAFDVAMRSSTYCVELGHYLRRSVRFPQ